MQRALLPARQLIPEGQVADSMRSMTPAAITQRAREATEASAESLAQYAVDPALPVRMVVAQRTDIPEQVCRRLAQDPAPEVRASVLVAGAPLPVLRELTFDHHPGVANVARHMYASTLAPDR